jgi:hypothetical protein
LALEGAGTAVHEEQYKVLRHTNNAKSREVGRYEERSARRKNESTSKKTTGLSAADEK